MESKLKRTGLVAQAMLYSVAGVNHFVMPGRYEAIMPPHYAHPSALIALSGAAEVLGGVGLLVPVTRRFSAWGIMAMLVVYFDVHFYMAAHAERFAPLPRWILYARIPLQLVLMAWAYVYARRVPERR